MNPTHPDLAQLALTTKKFASEIITTGHVVDLAAPLRDACGRSRGINRIFGAE
jgi:hypothetical protein